MDALLSTCKCYSMLPVGKCCLGEETTCGYIQRQKIDDLSTFLVA